MNTTRAGRRELNGLIVWKMFDRKLSQTETVDEVRNLENEGFEVRIVKNSHTIIIAVTSEGLAFSKSHLRNVGVNWERCVETHVQLNSRAQRKLMELEA